MGFSQRWIDTLYRLNASGYDAANEKRFADARVWLVETLALPPGAVVLDLGCGTGANLSLLSAAVGPDGRVLGLERGEKMLAVARRKVDREGLTNVSLAAGDARELGAAQLSELFQHDGPVDAAVACLLLSVVPDWQSVFERLYGCVRDGGAVGILDGVPRTGAGGWLTSLEDWLAAAEQRRPTWTLLDDAGAETTRRDFVRGTFHVTVGWKSAPS